MGKSCPSQTKPLFHLITAPPGSSVAIASAYQPATPGHRFYHSLMHLWTAYLLRLLTRSLFSSPLKKTRTPKQIPAVYFDATNRSRWVRQNNCVPNKPTPDVEPSKDLATVTKLSLLPTRSDVMWLPLAEKYQLFRASWQCSVHCVRSGIHNVSAWVSIQNIGSLMLACLVVVG